MLARAVVVCPLVRVLHSSGNFATADLQTPSSILPNQYEVLLHGWPCVCVCVLRVGEEHPVELLHT